MNGKKIILGVLGFFLSLMILLPSVNGDTNSDLVKALKFYYKFDNECRDEITGTTCTNNGCEYINTPNGRGIYCRYNEEDNITYPFWSFNDGNFTTGEVSIVLQYQYVEGSNSNRNVYLTNYISNKPWFETPHIQWAGGTYLDGSIRNASNQDSNWATAAGQTGAILNNGTWGMYTVTYEPENYSKGAQFFINDTLNFSRPSVGKNLYNSSFNFSTGWSRRGSFYPNSKIDDLMIFNRTLTWDEIVYLYDGGNFRDVETGFMDNCSNINGYDTNSTVLNFSVFHEDTLNPLIVNVTGVFTYTSDNISFYNSTITLTNTSNFQVCKYPANVLLWTDAYLRYDRVDGYNMRYYLENVSLSNVTENVYLYNFDTTTGISDLKALIYTFYYSPIQNVVMKLQRYYTGENVWRSVQIDKSDDFGEGIFYVYQNTVDYRFIWEVEGSQVGETQSLKFICDDSTSCEQTFTLSDPSDVDSYTGMDWGGTFTNSTGIYTFTWSDTNGLVSSVRLLVEKLASDGLITICDTTVSSASGSINCNVSGYTGTIQVRAIRAASPDDPFFSDFIERLTTTLKDIVDSTGKTNDAMFFSFLIAVVGIGFGAATGSAVAVVLIGIVVSIFTMILGITSILSYAVIVGLVVLGAIVAYIVHK